MSDKITMYVKYNGVMYEEVDTGDDLVDCRECICNVSDLCGLCDYCKIGTCFKVANMIV